MATQVRQLTATIPANTPMTALVTIPISLDYVDIESIDLEVPPGPSGLMGFYIARSGQQWIPFESGEFLVWDDRFDSWYLSEQPTGSGWQIVGYNTDVYDHSVSYDSTQTQLRRRSPRRRARRCKNRQSRAGAPASSPQR